MNKKKLVIVESPAKARTINKYLGKDYTVTSCQGHIIDLPKSRFGVDLDDKFTPQYITIRGRGKILKQIKSLSKNAEMIFLASDADREGESIAFHLRNEIRKKYPEVPIKRIVFNEITKTAIQEAIKDPGEIDQDKVDAQKARRILDRIVGYKISPLLWEKVKKGLSAGRVQSVALKIICEREEEINNFEPEEYWTLDMLFNKQGKKRDFSAKFSNYDGEKYPLNIEADVNAILDKVKGHIPVIKSITQSQRTRKPTAPFITSKLQQEASSRFNFSSAKTMMIAQHLYEGMDVGDETVGLITYMRTDSTRISPVALNEVRDFIKNEYGDEYLPESPNLYVSKKSAQDAHEAIRPTSCLRTPESLKSFLSKDEFKLYSLIWERFVSSQMLPVRYSTEKIEISAEKAIFTLNGSKIQFEGFSKALKFLSLDGKDVILPNFNEGDELDLLEYKPEQHFTQPPPRYNDASLVKFLEESGIGRPSTYAPIIMTLIKRYYVQRSGRQFVPTQLGILIYNILSENFQNLLDINFTAKMESELDEIEENHKEWVTLLQNFYPDFEKTLDEAQKNIQKIEKLFDETTNEVCEKCGAPMLKKLGKFGFFIACSKFPDCRNTKSISIMACPKEGCKGKIVQRISKKRKTFYGCSAYPNCDFVSWQKPVEKKCSQCGSFMVEKYTRKDGDFIECANNECKHREQLEGNDEKD